MAQRQRGLSWSSRFPQVPLEGASWSQMTLNPQTQLGTSWSMTLPSSPAFPPSDGLNPQTQLGTSWSMTLPSSPAFPPSDGLNPQTQLGTSWSMTLPSRPSSAFPLSDGQLQGNVGLPGLFDVGPRVLNGPRAPRPSRGYAWSDLRVADAVRPSSMYLWSDARADPTRPSSGFL